MRSGKHSFLEEAEIFRHCEDGLVSWLLTLARHTRGKGDFFILTEFRKSRMMFFLLIEVERMLAAFDGRECFEVILPSSIFKFDPKKFASCFLHCLFLLFNINNSS
jgi:hypothetical protein